MVEVVLSAVYASILIVSGKLVMVQVGVLMYALLAAFVSSSMSLNRREMRSSSHMMTMAGWSLFAFSMTISVLLFGTAGAMAAGFISDDAILFDL